MRQQVEGLMVKRDQMRKDLLKKDKQIDEYKNKIKGKNTQI